MNITNRSEARGREFRIQRYVETLELVSHKNYKYLKSIMEDFQDKCRLATSTPGAAPGLFTEIPDIYREIQKRLGESKKIKSYFSLVHGSFFAVFLVSFLSSEINIIPFSVSFISSSEIY